MENVKSLGDNGAMKLTWHTGDVIGKVREMREMTRAALADKVGISAYSMGQIEKTGNCRKTTLEKIASALKISVGFLYDEVPQAASVAAGSESLCSDSKHRTLQMMLDRIFHSETEWAPLISGNIISLHSSCFGEQPDLSLVVNGEAIQSGGPGLPDLPDPTLHPRRPKK